MLASVASELAFSINKHGEALVALYRCNKELGEAVPMPT